MRKFIPIALVFCIGLISSCKKNDGANPYDPNTKITVSVVPKVKSFAPVTGKTDDSIRISGVNFSTATAVSFGNMSAKSFVIKSDSLIVAVIGSGSSGPITVINPKGARALAGFTYIPPAPPVETGNLALNKPASASSSFNDPKLSVDGDLGTRWSTASATNNEWYKVDLQSIKKINRIDIKWEGAFASEYDLQVSTDNINFKTVYSTKANPGGDVSNVFTTTDARYVKILLIKGALPYPMSFWEFEVYADPPPINLALNKVATASTSFNDPKLSIDGNLGTRWSLAAATENEWYKVDLGKIETIGRVDIYWEGAYASEYALQISSDNVNFTTVFSTNASKGGDLSDKFTAVKGRYVKILLIKGALPYPMSFWEFEIYNK